jgi:transcriptional regulator with XRE-family HTH domain
MLALVMASEIQVIGDRLRMTREALKKNQATWCRMVGIDQQAWNNYERGRRRISLDHALKVVKATGVGLDWIYRGISKDLPHDIFIGVQAAEKSGR